jgi:hypothetical protein
VKNTGMKGTSISKAQFEEILEQEEPVFLAKAFLISVPKHVVS